MNKIKLLSSFVSFSGGVFVIMVTNIGPKELHRRILRSKPVCVVVAPCDQVNSKLLDVVDQVRNKHNHTLVSPSRVSLWHFLVGRVSVALRQVIPCGRRGNAHCRIGWSIYRLQMWFYLKKTFPVAMFLLLCYVLVGWFVDTCYDVLSETGNVVKNRCTVFVIQIYNSGEGNTRSRILVNRMKQELRYI